MIVCFQQSNDDVNPFSVPHQDGPVEYGTFIKPAKEGGRSLSAGRLDLIGP